MARKILLADDSVTAQNMGRKILADAGYEVIAVNNGSAALKKIAELKPDLVILDVYMPGYSGLEVCQRLKESQETSRIPVLLSVGKLEPFKPEEAQRVRADGYIVKPFEASELLSALAKLEDKVVPRAEPSKPGRFARAIAAAEESGRGKSNGDTNGWKSRIAFPPEKTESADKVADESPNPPIYNPMNRDLRTVVETAGEKAAEAAASKSTVQAGQGAEASVDVAALAPEGLPRDVTPEEIAAIAAAAAQIKMADAALRDEQRPSEVPAGETEITVASQASQDRVAEGTVDIPSAQDVYGAAQPTESGQLHNDDGSPQEPSDLPVTMAATADSVTASGGASRWTAVPVALDSEDATLSLDQEMQKAYTAYGAGALESGAAAPEAQSLPAEPFIAQAESLSVEAPVAAAGLEPVANPEPALAPEPAVSSQPIPVLAEPATETAAIEAAAETSASSSSAEPVPDPAHVAEFMSPVSEAEVAGLAGLVGLGAELQQPASQPELQIAAEPAADSETVKDTAAAWANWRQFRDNGKAGAVQATSPVVEAPEPVPAEAARAVAAGAEQITQEALAAPNHSPSDVASIVDSVLADLRPKLMAEISRKMAEKK